MAPGTICRLGSRLLRAETAKPYYRRPEDPAWRPLWVYTSDAGGSRLSGNLDVVRVPWEALEGGPRGAMFEVDRYDPSCDRRWGEALDLDHPSILLGQGLRPTPEDPRFHAQMVYAVASVTYDAFRSALGRDLAWGFERSNGCQRLKLRPFAGHRQNAYYDRSRGEVAFGYFRSDAKPWGRNFERSMVYTALSHDVVVHEVTHALLDGLRAHFMVPTGPDVLGFHEGFADLIAIFQKFSYPSLVVAAIRQVRGDLRASNLLTRLAEQFGHTTGQKGPLRNVTQVESEGKGGTPMHRYEPGLEPHRLGSVLASAVFAAFTEVYQRKVAPYLRLATGKSTHDPSIEPSYELEEILAEKAASLAAQFRDMAIRAIDYCPPVDLTLGEFLRAVITADREMVPEDPWGYREAWIDAFAARRIFPSGVATLSEESLSWSRPRFAATIPGLAFQDLKFGGDPARPANPEELQRQGEALGRFVSRPALRSLFGLRTPAAGVEPAVVESIRTRRRVGPSDRVVFDLVAEITQRCWHDLEGRPAPTWSGSTVVIGPEGELRYVIWSGPLKQGEAPLAGVRQYWKRADAWHPAPDLVQQIHDRRIDGHAENGAAPT